MGVGSTTTVHPAVRPDSSARDLLRQATVATSALVAILGLLVGMGWLGGITTEEAAGGALTSATTLIAPAGPAFSVWTPIYLGLLALGAWQLLPRRGQDARQRRVGWAIAVTMLANTAWIFVVQEGWIWVSIAVMAVLVMALAQVYARLQEQRPATRIEAVLVDDTMGAYLGWVCVAAIANVAAALVATGAPAIGTSSVVVTVAMIGAVVALGWFVAGVGRGRWVFSVTCAWGLLWIAVARAQGPTTSSAVAVAAAFGAVAVLAAPVAMSRRARSLPATAGQFGP